MPVAPSWDYAIVGVGVGRSGVRKEIAAVETVPYAGWENCLRLANGEIELVITAQVGPRVIRLGFAGEANLFANYPEQCGQTGGESWRSYGGHRLWHAPEVHGRTTCPDNHPVSWWQDEGWLHLQSPQEAATGIRKEIAIRLDEGSNHIRVMHALTNGGPWPVTLAPWAISVMAPGGTAIMPQEPFVPHPDSLLPVRSVALWSYTDMGDPRLTWGKRFVRLAHAEGGQPLKIGASVTPGWSCHVHQAGIFIKRFAWEPAARYPDLGCNCEIFTNYRMLEVETLGPLVTLDPGATVSHQEDWFVFPPDGEMLRSNDDELEGRLAPLLAQAGMGRRSPAMGRDETHPEE